MSQQLSLAARPRRFSDVIGQQKVTKELIAYHADNLDLPVALMFHGPSGTGKTSTARLCCLALECTHEEDIAARPCRECVRAYLYPDRYEAPENFAVDITEVNCGDVGIDKVREALAGVNHASALGARFKNYILDEFQSLHKKAQFMLLKVLEDSPETSKFYLCTTDPDSLIEGIRNRCTPYAFRLLKGDEIHVLVERLLLKRKSDLDPTVLSELLDERGVNSPRAITQAVTKYLSGADPVDAVSMAATGELDTGRICRAICKGDWQRLAENLTDLDEEQARMCRKQVVRYMTAILIQDESPSRRALASKSIIRLTQIAALNDSVIVASVVAGLHDCCAMFADD